MSDPVTPARASPALPHETPSESRNRSLRYEYKSPQVRTESNRQADPPVSDPEPDAFANKHPRSSPASGRGKLKKLRDKLHSKVAEQRFAKVTPSKLYARSMLTFDLHPGTIADGEIPGESELFVKFVTDRKKSTGRGSLKELINKRIAFQVGAKAIALREAEKSKPATEQVSVDLPEPPVEPQVPAVEKVKPKKSKKKVFESRRETEMIEIPLAQDSRRTSDLLEVPLGQADVVSKENEIPTVSQTQVLMSQTQVYHHEDIDDPRIKTPKVAVESTPLPFLPTPQLDEREPDLAVPSFRLETVVEETDEETPKRERVPKFRNNFVDDEAEESEDCDNDSEGSGSDGFLSDLIASSPDESSQDGSRLARLHAEWMREQEDKFDPFAIKGRKESSEDVSDVKQRRKKALLAAAATKVPSKPVRQPLKPKKPKQTVPEPLQPAPKPNVPLGKPRVKKYPHRRSSVSSIGSELEFRVGSDVLNRNKRSSFAFIKAPEKDKLDRILTSANLKDEAAAKASAGAVKLMGKKRFAFGD